MSSCSRTYGSLVRKITFSMFGLLFVLLPLSSCNTPAVPEALKFGSLNLGIPAAALSSPVTGTLPDATKLHVSITFKLDPNVLKKAQQQKLQPGKPSHVEQFASQLGISDATYQRIKGFFSISGMSVSLSKMRTDLTVNAKASIFAKLLRTKFVTHNYNGRSFFAPATPPQLPNFLLNSIDAVTGLDNFSTPPVHELADLAHTLRMQPMQKQQSQADCSPLSQTLLPRQVAGAYGFDQLWNQGYHGENMTVNLVEIDGSYKTDIDNYLSCIQFKGNFNVKDVDGHPQQALGESTLDIQMVAGLARSINIVAYQTDSSDPNANVWTNVNDMLQQIINDNTGNANSGNDVSISLGQSETDMNQDDVRAIDSSIQQLTDVEHMTVFVASGDCGAFTSGQYGSLSVAYPASDPNVVAVGGTVLQVNGSNGRANEVTWSDNSQRSQCKNSWGSGGGNSQLFPRQSWQNVQGVNNRYSQNNRQVPDVAAAAYGLAVYFQGQWAAVGGTSAASPIWATGMALVNQELIQKVQKFGYSPQLFYQVAQHSAGKPYYDVTQGNNLYYPAGQGWDYTTGLGTPNLPAFYQVAQTLV
jgi:subtilase family serine protease